MGILVTPTPVVLTVYFPAYCNPYTNQNKKENSTSFLPNTDPVIRSFQLLCKLFMLK